MAEQIRGTTAQAAQNRSARPHVRKITNFELATFVARGMVENIASVFNPKNNVSSGRRTGIALAAGAVVLSTAASQLPQATPTEISEAFANTPTIVRSVGSFKEPIPEPPLLARLLGIEPAWADTLQLLSPSVIVDGKVDFRDNSSTNSGIHWSYKEGSSKLIVANVPNLDYSQSFDVPELRDLTRISTSTNGDTLAVIGQKGEHIYLVFGQLKGSKLKQTIFPKLLDAIYKKEQKQLTSPKMAIFTQGDKVNTVLYDNAFSAVYLLSFSLGNNVNEKVEGASFTPLVFISDKPASLMNSDIRRSPVNNYAFVNFSNSRFILAIDMSIPQVVGAIDKNQLQALLGER